MSQLPEQVSGTRPDEGSDQIAVALCHEVLSIAKWRSRIEHPDVGAHAWFEGVTRRMTGQQETVRLEYDAYESMAYSELTSLARQIVERHSLYRLVIVHRLGIVRSVKQVCLWGVQRLIASMCFRLSVTS